MSSTHDVAGYLLRFCVLALILAASASTFLAQTHRGTIKGTVTDQNGGIVQNANVTIVNTGTNAERTVNTGEDGTYEVALLEPGRYKLTVKATSFSDTVRDDIVVRTASTEVVDFVLGAAAVGGVVNVTAEATLVQSETSDRGSVISGREVTELPLSGRNFTQLATLAPGVIRSNNVGLGGGPEARAFNNGDPRSGSGGPGSSNENGSSESSRFNRSGGANISANGQRPTNNNFSLDGVDNNEPQFGTIGVFPNPDSIAEFKVTTSVPPAEVGRAAGAVVTVTTKSGTNEFHGSLYYYGKNSALNAFHPVLKTKLAEAEARNASALEIGALQKPVQQEHEFGGTIGGPIIKNKTFFFFDYLGQRNNLPFPNDTVVPATGVLSGNFSAYPQIFNPFTGQAFTNNQIPSSMINSVGRNYLSAYPQPTRNVFDAGKFCNCSGGANYFFQRANNEEINNFKIRVDHRLSENNTLSGSFNDQRLTTLRANFFPGNIPTAGFGAGEERGNSRLITVSDVHTFKPTLLNEFRFGLTHIQISIFNCGVGGACGVSPTFASDIGIPNSNDGSVEASGGALIGNFETGFLEFTGDGGLFQVKSKNPYFADTVTFIKGDHTMKFGGELRLRYLNTIDGGRTGTLKGQFQYGNNGPATGPNANCPAGSGTTTNCFVRADGNPYGGSGNGQANILLGVPSLFVSKSTIFGGPFDLRSQEWGFFVQDDWKVNERLSLNLGLRYDIFTPFSEADGRYSLFNIADRQVIVASGGGDRIINTDLNNFGPRIGFAYSLSGAEKSLVLRGGYGLLYTLDGVDYPPGVRNVPFSNSVNFNQNGFNTSPTATAFTLQSGPPVVTSAPDPANVPATFGVFAVDEEQRIGLVHQFQLSLQYQFLKNYSLDIGYVGNRSRNLLYANNIGSGGTAEARNSANQFIGNATIYTNGARSNYDALQVQLQKRLANNFQGQVSYTFASNKDNSTGIFNGLGDQRQSRSGPINPFNLDADYGNSSLHARHLLSGDAIVDLPFGQGQRYLDQGGVSNVLVGGWQMNLIVSARSGIPYSVVTDFNGLGRPSLIGDPFANIPPGKVINPAAFSVTTGITTVTNPAGNSISFGDLERNAFHGPSQYFTDIGIFKNTKLSENWRLQLGVEFFNLFNHVNFTVPNNNVGNTASPNGDFGEIKYNAYGGRVIQYRVKFLF